MNGLAVVVKIFRCSGMNFQAADASGCERNLKKKILEEVVGVCVFSSSATPTISIRAYLRT